MKISEIKNSKFLKKEDVEPAILVTIREIAHENVGLESQAPDMKYVMYFDEQEKGMVLNTTNAELCSEALKSDETDDWIGHKIVLFNDPNVMYAGKRVGGIRVRAPKAQAAQQRRPVNIPDPNKLADMAAMENDIPWRDEPEF
jgi:hypothetical protein